VTNLAPSAERVVAFSSAAAEQWIKEDKSVDKMCPAFVPHLRRQRGLLQLHALAYKRTGERRRGEDL
jgi:hypothetical protein